MPIKGRTLYNNVNDHPGEKYPGNDIDIYLQPLVKELIELWDEGIETYDAFNKTIFNLRASLMWTISDFLGLCALSGWNTHTGLACPHCNFDTKSICLKHSKKRCSMGHQRFLDAGHKFRLQRKRFNGKQDRRPPPKCLSGADIVEQLANVHQCEFGKPIDEVVDPTIKGKKVKRKKAAVNSY